MPPPPPIPEKKKKTKQKKNSSQTCYRLRRPVNLLRLSENSIRDREVGNYLLPCANPKRDRCSGPPPPPPAEITSYIGFYRNKDLHPPPNPPSPPQKKSCTPPPPINVTNILNRKKYSCKKTQTKNTLIRVFFCYLSLGGGTIIFSFIRGLAPFWGSKF